MAQRFHASRDTFTSPNGAIGHRIGGSFDCLGPYAKVRNCPVMIGEREVARLTCYATGYADSAFSIPACTRRHGQHVRGYFTGDEGGTVFRVMNSHAHIFDRPDMPRNRMPVFGSPESLACVVPTVVSLPMGAGLPDRYCVVGTNYGYIHTTGGDIRTWLTQQGARHAAKRYVGL